MAKSLDIIKDLEEQVKLVPVLKVMSINNIIFNHDSYNSVLNHVITIHEYIRCNLYFNW